jgi:hypothetical protein
MDTLSEAELTRTATDIGSLRIGFTGRRAAWSAGVAGTKDLRFRKLTLPARTGRETEGPTQIESLGRGLFFLDALDVAHDI